MRFKHPNTGKIIKVEGAPSDSLLAEIIKQTDTAPDVTIVTPEKEAKLIPALKGIGAGLSSGVTLGLVEKAAPEFFKKIKKQEPGAFATGEFGSFLIPSPYSAPSAILKTAKKISPLVFKTSKLGRAVTEGALSTGAYTGATKAIESGSPKKALRATGEGILFGAGTGGALQGLSKFLETGGERILRSSIGPRPSEVRKAKDFDIKNIVKRDVDPKTPFKKGIEQIDKNIDNRLNELNNSTDKILSKSKKNIDWGKPYVSALKDIRKKEASGGLGTDSEQYYKELEKIRFRMEELSYKGKLPIETANNLKKTFSKKAPRIAGQIINEKASIKEQVQNKVSNSLRKEIVKAEPKLIPINNEFTELLPISKEIKFKTGTIENKKPFGLTDLLMGGLAGSAIGFGNSDIPGGIAGTIGGIAASKMLSSPYVGSKLIRIGKSLTFNPENETKRRAILRKLSTFTAKPVLNFMEE